MAANINQPLPRETAEADAQGYRRLVEAIADYAIYMLDPDGVIVSWNRGAERFKGYAAEDVLGTSFSRFYTTEDQAIGLPAHALATAAREGRFEAEGWRVRKDGSRFWAHVVVDPIRDEAGNLTGFAKITRDITARRETEAALAQAREALFQAQKLDALGQLTGGVAHDFNNLLQALTGCLEMIGRHTSEPAVQRLLEAGQQAIDRGARLIGQLLAFSRQKGLRPEPFGIPARLNGMLALLEPALRADIRLELEMASALWPVFADPTQFEMAVINLAVNARDAMPKGGVLRIRARNEVVPQGDMRGAAGEFVRISVEDTGCGMPPEVAARVFEPFFTTKPVGKGSGLGLPQVYGFARQAGGIAWVDSVPGRGTIVSMRLPRAREQISAGRPASHMAAPAAGRPGRVLLVEDDPVVAATVEAALQDADWQVLHCATADEALDRLRAGTPVDILFTDVVVPGRLDGVELTQDVKRLRPDLPMLLATGYSDIDLVGTGLPVLYKPYSLDELDRALRKAVASSTAAETVPVSGDKKKAPASPAARKTL